MNMKKPLTTSTVTEGLKKNLKAVPRKHSIPAQQNTATLGTSNVIQKLLQSETGDQS